MSTIVTRAGKGSPLTWNEVDNNFTNLNTDKLQSGNTAAALTITSATINGGTITGTALNGTLGATTPSTAVVTSLTDSALTSGRVTYASTGGLLADSASLTYDGTTLTSTKFAGAFNGSLGATTPSTVVATTINASVAVVATSTTTNSYFSSVSTNNGSGGSYRITSNTAGGVANTWYIGTNFTTNTNTFEIYDVALADKLFWSLPNTGNVTINKSIGVGAATPSASGAGITFPATQSASTNANTLDDYEEGTWTPTLAFAGASVGITYVSRYATYTKVGRMVTVIFYFQLSSKGSSSGQAQIGGFPFAFGSSISDVFNLMPARGYTNTGGQDVYLYTSGGQTVGDLYQNVNDGTANASVTQTAIANNSEFECSFSYFVT